MRFESQSSVRLLEGVSAPVKSNVNRNALSRDIQADTPSFLNEMKESMSPRPAPSRFEPRTHERRQENIRAERADAAPHRAERAETSEPTSHDQPTETRSDAAEKQESTRPSHDNNSESEVPTDKNVKADNSTPAAPENEAVIPEAQADTALISELITLNSEGAAKTQEATSQQNLLPLIDPQGLPQIAMPQMIKAQFEGVANENQPSPMEIADGLKVKFPPNPSALEGQLNETGNIAIEETAKLDSAPIAPTQAQMPQLEELDAVVAKSEIALSFVDQLHIKAEKTIPANSSAPSQGQIIAFGHAVAAQHTPHSTPIAAQQQVHHNIETSTLDALPFHVKRAAEQGRDILEIRLDPADLGKIEIRLERTAENKIITHIVADRPETLLMLQKDSLTLTKDMQNAGVQLDSGGMQFSLRQNHKDTEYKAQNSGFLGSDATIEQDNLANELPSSIIQNASAYNRLYIPGRVDLHV